MCVYYQGVPNTINIIKLYIKLNVYIGIFHNNSNIVYYFVYL